MGIGIPLAAGCMQLWHAWTSTRRSDLITLNRRIESNLNLIFGKPVIKGTSIAVGHMPQKNSNTRRSPNGSSKSNRLLMLGLPTCSLSGDAGWRARLMDLIGKYPFADAQATGLAQDWRERRFGRLDSNRYGHGQRPHRQHRFRLRRSAGGRGLRQRDAHHQLQQQPTVNPAAPRRPIPYPRSLPRAPWARDTNFAR